jgi:hypothetical protein
MHRSVRLNGEDWKTSAASWAGFARAANIQNPAGKCECLFEIELNG